jgi:hypothetical protein
MSSLSPAELAVRHHCRLVNRLLPVQLRLLHRGRHPRDVRFREWNRVAPTRPSHAFWRSQNSRNGPVINRRHQLNRVCRQPKSSPVMKLRGVKSHAHCPSLNFGMKHSINVSERPEPVNKSPATLARSYRAFIASVGAPVRPRRIAVQKCSVRSTNSYRAIAATRASFRST